MKNIIVFTVIAALFASCSSFLDKEAQGVLTNKEFFQTENDAFSSVVAAASSFKDYRYTRSIWAFGDITSDDATMSGSDNDVASARRWENLEFHADFARTKDRWNTCFQAVNMASQAIDGISAMDVSKFKMYNKERLLGEAYFIKSYFYFELVRSYGDLPLITKTPTIDDKTKKRSPKAEVYQIIEADLTAAAKNLVRKKELSVSEYGKPTSEAAWALLAKVYLYQEKYAESKKVIEDYMLPLVPGEYDLMPDFESIFSMKNEHCKESVFEINFRHKSDDWGLTTTGNYSAYAQGPRPFMGYGGNQPIQTLADAFEKNDTRCEATLLTTAELKKWETSDNFNSLVFNRTGYYNQKAYIKPYERIGTEDIFSFPNNLRVMRLSEIYLIYAEACNKQGADDLARIYVNKVRNRAGLAPISVSAEQLFKAIQQENRVEFAMEGHRYFNLIRTKTAKAALSNPAYKAIKPNANFKEGINELFPIPQSEIDNSQGNILQNPM
ncbi:MAG: RagB/SusD family nutrient uptake outer membrane protein [Bacteroidales bacterium]